MHSHAHGMHSHAHGVYMCAYLPTRQAADLDHAYLPTCLLAHIPTYSPGGGSRRKGARRALAGQVRRQVPLLLLTTYYLLLTTYLVRSRASSFEEDGGNFYAIRDVFYARESDGTNHKLSATRRAQIIKEVSAVQKAHDLQGSCLVRVLHESEMPSLQVDESYL